MSSATYQQLLDEVLPSAALAVERSFKLASKADVAKDVFTAPGKMTRFFDMFTGNTSKELVDQLNHMHKAKGEAVGALGKAQDTIQDLRRGSQRRATTDWLNTTGGKALAGMGATGAIAAPVAYGVGHLQGAKNKKRDRNMAFGSGMATGLAAPGMVNAGMSRLQQAHAGGMQPAGY